MTDDLLQRADEHLLKLRIRDGCAIAQDSAQVISALKVRVENAETDLRHQGLLIEQREELYSEVIRLRTENERLKG